MLLLTIIGIIVVLLGITAFTGAPYIPTKKREIIGAFDHLYPLSDRDVVLDLGSGDGVVLREAARRGAKAVGYELSPLLVGISRLISRSDTRIETVLANYFTKSFPDDTTLVYIFGDGRDIKKMTARVQSEVNRIGRPLHVLSFGFRLHEQAELKSYRAHFLYEIAPSALHSKKPQV